MEGGTELWPRRPPARCAAATTCESCASRR